MSDTLFITITSYAWRFLLAVLVFFIGRLLAKILCKGLRKVMAARHVEETIVSFVSSFLFIALMVVVIIAALGQLGVNVTPFVAVLGAAGLAVGLAFQGSLANFSAGILIILFKPFRVGDVIEAAGIIGTVRDITIFTTELCTADNRKVFIPNAKLTDDNIINISVNSTRRVDIVAGVSYEDNLDHVRKVLESILQADERILADPEPSIAVLELADSSVNIAVRPWVNTPDYWPVFFALQEEIKKRFDAEGISIPYPQRDVHLQKPEDAV